MTLKVVVRNLENTLIAAAPELLGALKDLVETIECVDHRLIEDLNPAILEFAWSAKKAVAKAEGRDK